MVAGTVRAGEIDGSCDFGHTAARSGPQRPNRVDSREPRRAKLVDVTRPRPPIGPTMAGAVDLSALKQSSPPSGDAGVGGSATPVGIEITEANFEDEGLLRSTQGPGVVLLWWTR